MKIIKRGERLDSRLGRKTCSWCLTVFEVEKGDIPSLQSHRGDPNDQREAGTWWEVPCPVCGKRVGLGHYDG